MNIHEALTFGETMLKHFGIDDPRWNAERLLLLTLNKDRAYLYSNLQTEVNEEKERAYRAMLSRRAVHYPLAYLEGVQEFFGREFIVNESVLIPRLETEEIIRMVLQLSLPSSPIILDIGSGSGAIGVTLAEEIPGARVVALELSGPALSVLLQNARGKLLPVRGDLYHLPFQDSSFDIVVSNPPYVELSEFKTLPDETRWEPREALVGSKDIFKTLIYSANRILKKGGSLIFEIGAGQNERISELSAKTPLTLKQIRPDHQNIPRTVLFQKD
jgi:release factor glutamine methyltransferase